ncbi:hypothetical protein BGZ80_009376 [Entomortierella chlamydospora]|uniref:Uncharacterized protein n=1 Tax=Entomortierella chlamydospora TaxID=101097 RepID=A0A9P6MXN5_9FUNG|nr:hypothetical protein BGZ80_009376 [Entomortierella chlamydospora]
MAEVYTHLRCHLLNVGTNPFSRRDGNPTLSANVKLTISHYSNIANSRLEDITVNAKTDQAKKDCSPEVLEPLVRATIEAETDLDDKWADNEETKRKLLDLDAKLMKLIQDRIQVNVNAGLLSKDCIEKMTNIETAPAEEPLNAESVEPEAAKELIPEAPTPVPEETPVPKPEAIEPAPDAPPPVLEEAPTPETPALEPKLHLRVAPRARICLNVDANIDLKFVCKSGCKGAKDARFVLDRRVDLEKKFKSRLGKFYEQGIPTECEKKRTSLVDSVLDLLSLNFEADVDVKTNASG